MKLDDLPRIFMDCCGEEPSRYDWETPFVEQGVLCATNGRIAVRAIVPADFVDEWGSRNKRLPPIGELPWAEQYSLDPTFLPGQIPHEAMAKSMRHRAR